MRWVRRLAFATGAFPLVACAAIVGLERVGFVDDDAASDGGDDQSAIDGGDARVDAPITPDGSIPFCSTVDATVCTDFDDDAGAGQPWRSALPGSEAVGMGLAPFVTSDPEQRDRGPFLVTKFVPDSGANPGYHASTRYRLDPAGFDGGIPPARRMELKLNVRASDEQTSSAFLSTDDSVPLTVALGCPNAAAECSIYVTRGTAAFPLADIVAPKKTWTHVVVEIPAATVEDGSAVYPTEIHVTVDSPGHPPLKKTAFIGGPGFVLVPSSEIVHIGLGRPNGQEGAWEVWYDDVAVTY